MLGLPSRIVSVPAAAIRFCRYTTAVLLWIAYFARNRELALVVALLLLANVVLGIRRAPLVALYTATFQRWRPSAVSQIDEFALRFAHSLGLLVAATGVALAYLPEQAAQGWLVLLALALMKTLGAIFMCPVSGLYACLASGGECCAFLRRKRVE